jgi:hypothetical protein
MKRELVAADPILWVHRVSDTGPRFLRRLKLCRPAQNPIDPFTLARGFPLEIIDNNRCRSFNSLPIIRAAVPPVAVHPFDGPCRFAHCLASVASSSV